MRRKVKAFFSIFIDSLIPQPREYRSFIHRQFLFSFKYISIYILILSSTLFFIYCIKIQPFSLISDISKSLSSFPNDLTISIKNGTVLKNYNRPYLMWLDHARKKSLLFMVEEQYPDQRLLDEFKPMIFLTQHMVIFRLNPTSGIYNLTDKNNILLTKNWFNTNSKYIKILLILFLPAAAVTFLFFIFSLISILTAISLMVLSLVGYILLHKLRHKHSFQKILQVGIHSSTLPLLLTVVIMAVQPKLSFPLYLFLILNLLFIGTAIYEALLYKKTYLS